MRNRMACGAGGVGSIPAPVRFCILRFFGAGESHRPKVAVGEVEANIEGISADEGQIQFGTRRPLLCEFWIRNRQTRKLCDRFYAEDYLVNRL